MGFVAFCRKRRINGGQVQILPKPTQGNERRKMIELLELKNSVWQSTDGKTYFEECEIITEDEGGTFFCLTHNKKLFCGKCEDRV